MRETVDCVTALATDDQPATMTVVAQRLGLDVSSASRRVRAATAKGYVRNLEDSRGRPSRLVPGDPMPDRFEILPLPERLHVCSEDDGGTRPSADNSINASGGVIPLDNRANAQTPAVRTVVSERFDIVSPPDGPDMTFLTSQHPRAGFIRFMDGRVVLVDDVRDALNERSVEVLWEADV